MKQRSEKLGTKNIVGSKIAAIRLERGIKQKDFLARLQVLGLDISETSLSRIEGQHRLVKDFELMILAKALCLTTDELLNVYSGLL